MLYTAVHLKYILDIYPKSVSTVSTSAIEYAPWCNAIFEWQVLPSKSPIVF